MQFSGTTPLCMYPLNYYCISSGANLNRKKLIPIYFSQKKFYFSFINLPSFTAFIFVVNYTITIKYYGKYLSIY